MRIELVGLAYDRISADSVWSKMPAKDAYSIILRDEFRRKVDPRSQLYHKGHVELITELESFLKQGGERLSMVQLLADRFSAGVEKFPSQKGELAFDFQLIRHFSSLAMADDFLVAESFLRALLRKAGFLKNGAAWSLLEARDFDGIVAALRDVRMQDISDVSQTLPESAEISFEHLVRNYIEFLNYSKNNRLTPFFYNSETDFKRWGDLTERKNNRNEIVVDLSMHREGPSSSSKDSFKRKPRKLDVMARMKMKREVDALLGGLRDSDPLIRQKAAETLGLLADPETLPNLIEALSDSEPEVRQEIVRTIGSIGNPKAREALLPVVEKDPVFSVQLTAAFVLQSQGDKKVIPLLIDALEQGKPRFSVLLAYHPGLPADRAAHSRLQTLAHHEDAAVRREVAFVFGRLPKYKDGRERLGNMIQDLDEETRCNALYSLWDIRDKNLPSIANKLASHSSEATSRAGSIVRSWVQDKSKRN